MPSKQDNSKYDFYRRTGATPPSHEEHGTDKDLEELRKWSSDHAHKWKQNGAYIECSEGNVVHGSPLPSIHHILIGTASSGAPEFKDLRNST